MANPRDFFAEVLEIADADCFDELGEIIPTEVDNRYIGHLFEEDNHDNKLVAYHRANTGILELSCRQCKVKSKADLHPVIIFPRAEDLVKYIRTKEVSYRVHDGQYDAAGVERMIHIGTHLPMFVQRVSMQKENYNRLELTHQDERFNATCANINRTIGARLKDVYFTVDELKFTWIEAGGHGKAGGPEA